MSSPQNLLELQLLLESVYKARGPDNVQQSDQHLKAAKRLVEAGMCNWVPGNLAFQIRSTEKGSFYIHHIADIPYPVEETTFKIPEKTK